MRLTKVCRQLTGVETLYARDLALTESGLVFAVRPRWRKPRCGDCGRSVWTNSVIASAIVT